MGFWENPIFGKLELCPVAVFRKLRERAKGLSLCNIGKGEFQRTLNHLLKKAKIPNNAPGRERQLYTQHSTRVTGTCYLLRCGLLPLIISAIADWSSDMVSRYGRRILLNPLLVEPVKFYNPKSMGSSHGPVGNGLAQERKV